jgi:FtsH-binding integral membrane protein
MFNKISPGHTTKDSPKYKILSKSMAITIATSTLLFLVTVIGMFLLVNTKIAEIGSLMFRITIIGVLIFGGLISLGRYLGIKGIGEKKIDLAFIGSAILVFTYSWFGGIILSRYKTSLYFSGIIIATIITLIIAIAAGIYVYSTDKDMSIWAKYSMILFLSGLFFAFITRFFSKLIWVSFFCILFGFIADLIYEIWMTSNKKRSPFANGIALYVAFTGTFVHILQLVLSSLEK